MKKIIKNWSLGAFRSLFGKGGVGAFEGVSTADCYFAALHWHHDGT